MTETDAALSTAQDSVLFELRNAQTGELVGGMQASVDNGGKRSGHSLVDLGGGNFKINRWALPERGFFGLRVEGKPWEYEFIEKLWSVSGLLADGLPYVVELKPVEVLEYIAVDETGLALEGVQASRRWVFYREDRTDAQGFGRVLLPQDEELRQIKLQARNRQHVRLDLRDGPPDHRLRVVFPPPASLRLRLPPGTPPAGYRAMLQLGDGIVEVPYQLPFPYARMTEDPEGTRFRQIYREREDTSQPPQLLFEVAFDADGEATLFGFRDVGECTVELRFLEEPVTRLVVELLSEGGEKVVDLPAATNARYRTLRVIDEHGRALEGVEVTVDPVSRDPSGGISTIRVDAPPPMVSSSDSKGRAELPVGRDDSSRLVLLHGSGLARQVRSYAELAQDDWTVRLLPGQDFRLTTVDRDGVAVSRSDQTPVYGYFYNHLLVHLGHDYWTEGTERVIALGARGKRDSSQPDLWIFKDLPAGTLEFTFEQLGTDHAVRFNTRLGGAFWQLPVAFDEICLRGFK